MQGIAVGIAHHADVQRDPDDRTVLVDVALVHAVGDAGALAASGGRQRQEVCIATSLSRRAFPAAFIRARKCQCSRMNPDRVPYQECDRVSHDERRALS